MSRTLTIDRLDHDLNKWREVIWWLDENVGPIKTWGTRKKAYGWEMWDTELKTEPYSKQTKIMFYKAENAMLFAMRWAK
jgi:hypothetical protein